MRLITKVIKVKRYFKPEENWTINLDFYKCDFLIRVGLLLKVTV